MKLFYSAYIDGCLGHNGDINGVFTSESDNPNKAQFELMEYLREEYNTTKPI